MPAFLNAAPHPRAKSTPAIKSGMLAAVAIADALGCRPFERRTEGVSGETFERSWAQAGAEQDTQLQNPT